MYSPLQLAKKYGKHWLSASNAKGHGVHSPFVFDLIKQVLNDRKEYDCYVNIEALRKQLLSNRKFIKVEDFGAGSAHLKTNERSIYKMAASSLKPKKYAQLLYRMVKYYQPGTIVELGTSFGITTAYLASGNEKAQVYTMEGATSIAGLAHQHFETLKLKNIQLITGNFDNALPKLLATIQKVDFAFIDGNHSKEPTLAYFEQLLNHTTDSTVLIFDDIHWSAGMETAWEKIKEHYRVTLTIDLFFIGIVYLNKDFKAKQHFHLRF